MQLSNARREICAEAARLKQPALFLFDEFAALGRLEAVERAMGLMAGYGLHLWPILQDKPAERPLRRAGRHQGVELTVQVLVFCADAGISDDHAALCQKRPI